MKNLNEFKTKLNARLDTIIRRQDVKNLVLIHKKKFTLKT